MHLQGLMPFEGHDLATGETSTRGLDTLAAAAAGYRQAGARFAKWRAALRVDAARGFPSDRAVELNAEQLAQYAAVCQAAGGSGCTRAELRAVDCGRILCSSLPGSGCVRIVWWCDVNVAVRTRSPGSRRLEAGVALVA
jgi:hypothetical protein